MFYHCLMHAVQPELQTVMEWSVSFLQPLETKLMSETSGLFEANHVARTILNDAMVSDQFFVVIS